MSQITTKWIADKAITPDKIDSTAGYTVGSITATSANIGALTVPGGITSLNGIFQDATVNNGLSVGENAFVGNELDVGDNLKVVRAITITNGADDAASLAVQGSYGALTIVTHSDHNSITNTGFLSIETGGGAYDMTVAPAGDLKLVPGSGNAVLEGDLAISGDTSMAGQMTSGQVIVSGPDYGDSFVVQSSAGLFKVLPFSDHFVVSSSNSLYIYTDQGDMTLAPGGELQITGNANFNASNVTVNTGNVTVNGGHLQVNGGDISSTGDIHANGAMSAETTFFCNNGITTYSDSTVGYGTFNPSYSNRAKLSVVANDTYDQDGLVAQAKEGYAAVFGENVSGSYQSTGVIGKANNDGTGVFGWNVGSGLAGYFLGKTRFDGDATVLGSVNAGSSVVVNNGGSGDSTLTGNALNFDLNSPSIISNNKGLNSSITIQAGGNSVCTFAPFNVTTYCDTTASINLRVGNSLSVGGDSSISGNIVAGTLGCGLAIRSGVGARVGKTTVNGPTPINNSTITENTRVFLTPINNFVAHAWVASYINGTSFTINCDQLCDVSWLLVEAI